MNNQGHEDASDNKNESHDLGQQHNTRHKYFNYVNINMGLKEIPENIYDKSDQQGNRDTLPD